jgi:hypothetical protein
MAHFDFFDLECMPQVPSNLIHDIERGPFQGLINQQYLPFHEILQFFEVHHRHFGLNSHGAKLSAEFKCTVLN